MLLKTTSNDPSECSRPVPGLCNTVNLPDFKIATSSTPIDPTPCCILHVYTTLPRDFLTSLPSRPRPVRRINKRHFCRPCRHFPRSTSSSSFFPSISLILQPIFTATSLHPAQLSLPPCKSSPQPCRVLTIPICRLHHPPLYTSPLPHPNKLTMRRRNTCTVMSSASTVSHNLNMTRMYSEESECNNVIRYTCVMPLRTCICFPNMYPTCGLETALCASPSCRFPGCIFSL